jgi:hypothetical protein
VSDILPSRSEFETEFQHLLGHRDELEAC